MTRGRGGSGAEVSVNHILQRFKTVSLYLGHTIACWYFLFCLSLTTVNFEVYFTAERCLFRTP